MSIVERIGVGVENAVMGLAAVKCVVEKPGYFYKREPDEKIVNFASIVEKTIAQSFHRDGYWAVECSYNRETRATNVLPHNEFDSHKPTIIWHHGAGNIRYEWQMGYFLDQEMFDKFNILSIKAAHHNDRKDYLENCMDSFLHWQMTFAGSVLAEEEVVKYCRQQSKQPVIITGTSMGGIVASWHWLLFNTADYYFPIVAQPNVGEIFFGEGYVDAVDRREVRLSNEGYLKSFSSTPGDDEKITPILGRYDQLVTVDKAEKYWHKHQPVIYPTGHATIALKAGEIRRTILDKVVNQVHAD